MKKKVDFLYADKHERFLRNDTIILDVGGQACPNNTKYKFVVSLQYLKEVCE